METGFQPAFTPLAKKRVRAGDFSWTNLTNYFTIKPSIISSYNKDCMMW
jgi:hypothetical protein